MRGPIDLLDDEPLEIELATTLLYGVEHYSYRQVREAVEALSSARRQEIIDHETSHGTCTQTFIKKIRKQVRPRP